MTQSIVEDEALLKDELMNLDENIDLHYLYTGLSLNDIGDIFYDGNRRTFKRPLMKIMKHFSINKIQLMVFAYKNKLVSKTKVKFYSRFRK